VDNAPLHVHQHVQARVHLHRTTGVHPYARMGEPPLASRSTLTITVTKSNSASTVLYRDKGRYATINTNTVYRNLLGQPLFTTASEKAFWEAVVAVVLADLPSA